MLAGQCRVGCASQASSALWPGRGKPSVGCARGPSSVSAQKPVKIKKIIFYFSFGFKLKKFVSKYPELQK
jgi:hypothetical protein